MHHLSRAIIGAATLLSIAHTAAAGYPWAALSLLFVGFLFLTTTYDHTKKTP